MSQNGQPRRHVMLGMPGYGGLTTGAARGFYRATAGKKFDLALHCESGSLLANNMNRLWCVALNKAKKGECDVFAMIHSDVEPPDFWLDTLIDEMIDRDLDVLGVVVPIKDTRGLTSTALARDDGSTWRVHCRLSMAEVHRLPETFTSVDVGGRPLLLNTGLWACRFREDWARKCFFTINDRIMLDPDGEYVSEVEPEDWFFSRLVHDLGLKVGCTRKVKVLHHGDMAFVNDRVWGTEEFDGSLLTGSVIPDWFPHDVEGWLLESEGRELARLAAGKDVLEIGSYCGRSTICLAHAAKSVVAVDPFDGRGTPDPRDTAQEFVDNLQRYGVYGRVLTYPGTAEDALRDCKARFDLAFIDGAHDRESVETDLRLARGLLRDGGLLAFHDYRDRSNDFDGHPDPGVKAAVDNLIASGGKLVRRVGTLAVVQPPAEVTSFLEG